MAKPAPVHRTPFKTGDRVAIIRSRHGWFDGQIQGIVVKREQHPHGTWSYVVRDDDGYEHDILHTRDLSTATLPTTVPSSPSKKTSRSTKF